MLRETTAVRVSQTPAPALRPLPAARFECGHKRLQGRTGRTGRLPANVHASNKVTRWRTTQQRGPPLSQRQIQTQTETTAPLGTTHLQALLETSPGQGGAGLGSPRPAPALPRVLAGVRGHLWGEVMPRVWLPAAPLPLPLPRRTQLMMRTTRRRTRRTRSRTSCCSGSPTCRRSRHLSQHTENMWRTNRFPRPRLEIQKGQSGEVGTPLPWSSHGSIHGLYYGLVRLCARRWEVQPSRSQMSCLFTAGPTAVWKTRRMWQREVLDSAWKIQAGEGAPGRRCSSQGGQVEMRAKRGCQR